MGFKIKSVSYAVLRTVQLFDDTTILATFQLKNKKFRIYLVVGHYIICTLLYLCLMKLVRTYINLAHLQYSVVEFKISIQPYLL